MAVGLGTLSLAPDVFWRMTPRELEAAIVGRMGEGARDMPMGRGELERMMRDFPDRG